MSFQEYKKIAREVWDKYNLPELSEEELLNCYKQDIKKLNIKKLK